MTFKLFCKLMLLAIATSTIGWVICFLLNNPVWDGSLMYFLGGLYGIIASVGYDKENS